MFMLSELERPKPAIVYLSPLRKCIVFVRFDWISRCVGYVTLWTCRPARAAFAMSQAFGGMGAYGNELYASYSAVEARREWELGRIKEKLTQNEKVDTAVCRVERVSA